MSRRATLPGADELFRRTSDAPEAEVAAASPAGRGPDLPQGPAAVDALADGLAAADSVAVRPTGSTSATASGSGSPARRRPRSGERRPTGRERHEEKITVYVSPEELVDIEQAKLALRAQHGLAVDRGRIVREAVAVVIADLESKGEDSILVRRLRGL
jgi:hypothetical protein